MLIPVRGLVFKLIFNVHISIRVIFLILVFRLINMINMNMNILIVGIEILVFELVF